MSIFFNNGLTRKPEIGNTPAWVLPNIWRLERVRDTKFGTDVSDEMLLNTAKSQVYNFYSFWVIKGEPTMGGGGGGSVSGSCGSCGGLGGGGGGGGGDEIAPHPPPLSRFSNILFKNNSQDLFDIEVADLIHVREKLFLKFKK